MNQSNCGDMSTQLEEEPAEMPDFSLHTGKGVPSTSVSPQDSLKGHKPLPLSFLEVDGRRALQGPGDLRRRGSSGDSSHREYMQGERWSPKKVLQDS